MLGVRLVQIVFAVAAVYFGGKVAMSFGRDLRKNLFHQVTDFSAREVGTFGAPSLITRITNDVQQVQMLVVMACTMAIAAPITMVVGVILALRQTSRCRSSSCSRSRSPPSCSALSCRGWCRRSG